MVKRATHIFEIVSQIFSRPNETLIRLSHGDKWVTVIEISFFFLHILTSNQQGIERSILNIGQITKIQPEIYVYYFKMLNHLQITY